MWHDCGDASLCHLYRTSFKNMNEFGKQLRIIELADPSSADDQQRVNMTVAKHLGKTNWMSYDFKEFKADQWINYHGWCIVKDMPKFQSPDKQKKSSINKAGSCGDGPGKKKTAALLRKETKQKWKAKFMEKMVSHSEKARKKCNKMLDNLSELSGIQTELAMVKMMLKYTLGEEEKATYMLQFTALLAKLADIQAKVAAMQATEPEDALVPEDSFKTPAISRNQLPADMGDTLDSLMLDTGTNLPVVSIGGEGSRDKCSPTSDPPSEGLEDGTTEMWADAGIAEKKNLVDSNVHYRNIVGDKRLTSLCTSGKQTRMQEHRQEQWTTSVLVLMCQSAIPSCSRQWMVGTSCCLVLPDVSFQQQRRCSYLWRPCQQQPLHHPLPWRKCIPTCCHQ